MSTFRKVFSGLRAEVRSPRHHRTFADARQRHAALSGHATVGSALAVLADDGAGYAGKEAITRALIAEQQERPSPFWAAALLMAYYPLLSRLRHRIRGDALQREDLDQLVLASFLSVVAGYPLAAGLDRTAMRLRQGTEREVFRIVRGEQCDRERMCPLIAAELDKLAHGPWPEMPPDPDAPRSPKDVAEAVSLLLERAGSLLDGETFDLMTGTLICGQRIGKYLEAVAPDMTRDERRAIYPRIKRRHSRALMRIRPGFA